MINQNTCTNSTISKYVVYDTNAQYITLINGLKNILQEWNFINVV